MIDLEKVKNKVGYDGKPQQFKYGFDLAVKELASELNELKEKLAKVESGEFVIVPREPTEHMVEHAHGTYEGAAVLPYSFYKAMIEAAQENRDE